MKKILFIILTCMTSNIIAQGQIPEKIKINEAYTTTSGLKMIFSNVNQQNVKPVIGDKVKIHLIGKITSDSNVWANSYLEGNPITIEIGSTKIKGLDEALIYMHQGDKANVTIPAALGFGEQSINAIPPNSTLVVDLELVEIVIPPKPFVTEGLDTTSLPSGLKYIVVSKGRGIKVDTGMMVRIHYTGFFENGKIFDSSIERGEPIKIPIGEGKVIKGWDEGITKLCVGDKARLLIPYTLAYGETERGSIPAKSNLIFDVEILSADKIEKPIPYNVEGKDTLVTSSGLKYIIVNKGTGTAAAEGKKVSVHYTGYFTDGSLFDSSVERGEAFSFVLGGGQVIKGWDEGVALMKMGDKFRFVIPYHLAYGENEYGPIPGKSTLVFDVELLNVE